MKLFTFYKLVKEQLASVGPCFYFTGQYSKGTDNTSYKVPVIYIEMPKDLRFQYFPGSIKTSRTSIKIHIVSHAPYKSHDNTIQDTAIAFHENMNSNIEHLLSGWKMKGTDGKLNSQVMINAQSSIGNFQGTIMFSVLTFETELIFYS